MTSSLLCNQVPNLPAGDYYLCMYGWSSATGEQIQWYGSTTQQTIDDWEGGMPTAPADADLIHVGPGQDVTINLLDATSPHAARAMLSRTMLRIPTVVTAAPIDIAYRATADQATIAVYSFRGQQVARIATIPGQSRVRWDGCNRTGRPVPAGHYVFELSDGAQRAIVSSTLLGR